MFGCLSPWQAGKHLVDVCNLFGQEPIKAPVEELDRLFVSATVTKISAMLFACFLNSPDKVALRRLVNPIIKQVDCTVDGRKVTKKDFLPILIRRAEGVMAFRNM
jgi:hypothetical protein